MKLIPAAVVAFSGVFLCAQAPIIFSSVVQTALEGFGKGAYFQAHDALVGAAFAPDGQVRDRVAFGLWTQFSPLLTNELDPKVMARHAPAADPDPTWAKRLSAADPRDAIEEIVARAR